MDLLVFLSFLFAGLTAAVIIYSLYAFQKNSEEHESPTGFDIDGLEKRDPDPEQ